MSKSLKLAALAVNREVTIRMLSRMLESSKNWLYLGVKWGFGGPIGLLLGLGAALPSSALPPQTTRPQIAPAQFAQAQTTLSAPTRSLLQLGSKGPEVIELQGVLKLMGLYDGGVDGTYGESTLIAVTRFQQVAGLSQDGIVGAATWVKLLPPAPGEPPAQVIVPAAPAPTPAPKPAPAPTAEPLYPILRKGAVGPGVRRLQERLRQVGVYDGPIDGGFGEQTEAAVKAAQRRFKLTDDGVVGGATWDALNR
jgi:N-acetylmuramoyl-L-alanine amidase